VSTASNDVDEIRRRMAEIRHDLHQDVQGVVATAEAVTDWRRHLTGHPWLALGAAFAVGYFIVPRRRTPEITTTVASAIADGELAKIRESLDALKDQAGVAKPKPKKGLVGAALGMIVPLVLRAGQGYAMSYLENWIAEQQAVRPGPAPGGAPSADPRVTRTHNPYRPGGSV
jgi:hypothetical protein